MKSVLSKTTKILYTLLFSAMLLSGCSGSNAVESEAPDEPQVQNSDEASAPIDANDANSASDQSAMDSGDSNTNDQAQTDDQDQDQGNPSQNETETENTESTIQAPVHIDVISIDNYQQILLEAIYYINREPFEDFVEPLGALDQISEEILSDIDLLDSVGLATINTARATTYGCPGGGERIIYSSADGNPYTNTATQFKNCVGNEGTIYNGIKSGTSQDFTHSVARENLSLSHSANLQHEYHFSNNTKSANNARFMYTNLTYSEQDGEFSKTITNYDLGQSWIRSGVNTFTGHTVTFGCGIGAPGAFIAYHVKNVGTVSGGFEFQSTATSGHSVTVDVDIVGSTFAINYGGQDLSLEEFLATSGFDTGCSALPYTTSEEPWQWKSGSFVISAEDGSSMILTNFRQGGFDVNLFDAQNHNYSSIPIEWANGFVIPCRSGYCSRLD